MPARTKPRKRVLTPKVSSEAVKAKADAAAARSAGEEIEAPKVEITPEIIPAATLIARDPAAKEKAIAKRRRRRVRYSEPLGKAICKMLGMGLSLTSICSRPLMPKEGTVLAWAIDPSHPFSDRYVRAREVGYYRMADEIVDISDNSLKDTTFKVTKSGDVVPVINRECIERHKLRIETRKWVLSKMLPRAFGDRVAMEHTGKDGGPIETMDRPQPTGSDHLADVAKRFAARAPAAKVHPEPAAKPQGKGSAGLH